MSKLYNFYNSYVHYAFLLLCPIASWGCFIIIHTWYYSFNRFLIFKCLEWSRIPAFLKILFNNRCYCIIALFYCDQISVARLLICGNILLSTYSTASSFPSSYLNIGVLFGLHLIELFKIITYIINLTKIFLLILILWRICPIKFKLTKKDITIQKKSDWREYLRKIKENQIFLNFKSP